MKNELLQPTATIVAALIEKGAFTNSDAIIGNLSEVFISTYKALADAQAELQKDLPAPKAGIFR